MKTYTVKVYTMLEAKGNSKKEALKDIENQLEVMIIDSINEGIAFLDYFSHEIIHEGR